MAQAPLRTPMITAAEQDEIATAWLLRQRNQWCLSALGMLIDFDPETAWSIIVRLVLEAPDGLTLINAAAGPLQELLAGHGAVFVSRAEQLARTSPDFQFALQNVWLPKDDSTAARRLEALGCQRFASAADDRGRLS